MSFIEIGTLLEKHKSLKLRLLGGEGGLSRHLDSVDVNRPGLGLAGFFENFANNRLQVFGKGESAYMQTLSKKEEEKIYRKFFSYTMPGIIFTHGEKPPQFFIDLSNEKKTPVISTTLSTHAFIVQFTRIVGDVLAPRTSLHGVLIEVFGVGVLLMGQSGIGKSETAIELIERGHRLVADDVVQVICVEESLLYGISNEVLQHNMELRGLGIVNVRELFGMRAIRDRYPLELVVYLEEWNPKKNYDRLGLDEGVVNISGVEVPRILLPIRPGRNIPVLIETAAINHRSQKLGSHAARDLTKKVAERAIQKIKKKKPLPNPS